MRGVEDRCVAANLDALLAALYVHLDDDVLPWLEQVGFRARVAR